MRVSLLSVLSLCTARVRRLRVALAAEHSSQAQHRRVGGGRGCHGAHGGGGGDRRVLGGLYIGMDRGWDCVLHPEVNKVIC